MIESNLEEIIIRLRLILALLKANEVIQAIEYLEILTEKYGMNDLATIKRYINSNEINSALLLVEQAIDSYENISRSSQSVIEIDNHEDINIQESQYTHLIIPFKKDDKWGYKDLQNNIIIECIYEEAKEFNEGRAGVRKDGFYGFIDINGQICSDLIYERIESFSDGMAAVCIRSNKEYSIFQDRKSYLLKWGFINHKGILIIPCIYSDVKRFSEGLAMVTTLNNYYQGMPYYEKKYNYEFIDKTGATTIKLNNCVSSTGWDSDFWWFHNKAYEFIGGRCKIYTPYSSKPFNQDAVINNYGDIILSNVNYDRIIAYSEGLSAVAKVAELKNSEGEEYFEHKWGFVDVNGNEVINCKFDNVGSFKDGLAPASIGEKWGFIDRNGFFVINCIYDAVRPFSEGLAAVYREVLNIESKNNKLYKWGFIDSTGKMVIPCIYDGYSLSYEEFIPGFDSFKNGLVRVKKGEKHFIIDKKGDIIK